MRSIKQYLFLEGVMGHIPASKRGVGLMKQYARMIGGSFIPKYDDPVEGVSWPAVVQDGQKLAFEYDGSFFMRDDDDELVEVPIDIAEKILNGYAMDVFNRGVDPHSAAHQLFRELEMYAKAR